MGGVSQRKRKLKGVLRRFRREYGRRGWRSSGDPVSVLMGTILSQNTNSTNSSAGFRRLREDFPTWDEVADAPVRSIERCIRTSGLGKTKAPRMRSILREIRSARAAIDLNFLKELDSTEALDYLTRFKGVGAKTALCVLLFAFGMKVFPVDTHIRRIAIRLGVIGPDTSLEAANRALGPLVAPQDRYEMHVLTIAHGREVCLKRKPRCEQCCILEFCPHGLAALEQSS